MAFRRELSGVLLLWQDRPEILTEYRCAVSPHPEQDMVYWGVHE